MGTSNLKTRRVRWKARHRLIMPDSSAILAVSYVLDLFLFPDLMIETKNCPDLLKAFSIVCVGPQVDLCPFLNRSSGRLARIVSNSRFHVSAPLSLSLSFRAPLLIYEEKYAVCPEETSDEQGVFFSLTHLPFVFAKSILSPILGGWSDGRKDRNYL